MEKIFMAFAKGKEVVENTGVVKRYIGVGSVKVLAVNPTKAELETIYGTTLERDVEYTSTTPEGVQAARIDFIVSTDPKNEGGIDMKTKASFFLRKEFMFNQDKSKVKVMDKYGRTAWVTKEQFAAKEIPMYSNGPANIDADYKMMYRGEEELVDFLKNYLGIPNVTKFVDGKPAGLIDNPSEAEARLEGLDKYFNGDFSELKEIMSYQPNNKVKLCFGVKTTDDGKQYQDVFIQMSLKNGNSRYDKLEKAIEERKAMGGYPHTEFAVCDLKEYVVTPTTFTEATTDTAEGDPWGFGL